MIVVPVYDMILAPDATLYLPLEQLRRCAGDRGVAVNEKIVLLVAKENVSLDDLDGDSFYPVGAAGAVKELHQQGYATVRTQYRVNVENVSVNPDHTIGLTMSRRPETEDLEPAVEARKLKSMKEEMRKFSSGFSWGDSARYIVDQIDTLGMAACVMSQFLQCSNEERYAILAEDSRAKRAEMIEKMLYEFMEVGRIANEAATSQQQEMQQRYKDMEAEMNKAKDVQKFAQRIADSGMNETARREAEKVLNRLKQEGKEGVESAMLYDYLDFVTTLSWKKEAAERIDLKEARRILDEDHYGLDKVKDRIVEYLARYCCLVSTTSNHDVDVGYLLLALAVLDTELGD